MKVVNKCSNRIHKNLDKLANKLLGAVPNEHLVGLESITLLDNFNEAKYKNNLGLYWPKNKSASAKIDIAVLKIYGNDFYFYLIPFLGNYMFAKVLLHEVGHHYIALFKHGMSKKEREAFAEDYCEKFIIENFQTWFYILRPFAPLISFVGKLLKKYARWLN